MARNVSFQHSLREFLASFADTVEGFLQRFSERLIRKVFQKYALVAIGAVAALTVAFNGLGILIGSFFPEWRGGISHIIVGILLFLAILAYGRRK